VLLLLLRTKRASGSTKQESFPFLTSIPREARSRNRQTRSFYLAKHSRHSIMFLLLIFFSWTDSCVSFYTSHIYMHASMLLLTCRPTFFLVHPVRGSQLVRRMQQSLSLSLLNRSLGCHVSLPCSHVSWPLSRCGRAVRWPCQ